MRPASHLRPLVLGLMVAFGLTQVNARADITIAAGTDYLYTQPGTYYTFPSPIGVQPLVGNPVYAGGTDTVVDRLQNADATTGAPINTQITGLSLLGTGAYSGLSVTLDPNNLANDTGTMSFTVTSPIVVGEISGTIVDTLNVYYVVSIPGVAPVYGHELFTSYGYWQAYLTDSGLVLNFQIIIDTHVDPNGRHIVSSFIPEPSSWFMLLSGGLVVVPAYFMRGRRRARSSCSAS